MERYQEYVSHKKKIAALSSSAALLQWDQEVYMPPAGSEFRAIQLSELSGLIHKYAVEPALGKFLDKNQGNKELTEEQLVNITKSLDDYKKESKIPAELVEKLSRAQSQSFQAWIEARKKNDFSIYQPYLHEIFQLKKRYAEYLGTSDDPYETLMDLYDSGIKVEEVDRVFEELIDGIHSILGRMDSIKFQENLPEGYFKQEKQLELGESICKQLGFNYTAGRQDLSAHPFTIGFHPDDVRITTRVDEKSLAYMLWSTIHECGHALYEQGLKKSQHGLPLGEAASLSIHESQSRLYENNIGRSKIFIDYWFPTIQATFAEALKTYDAEKYYHAVNKIEPGFIRTESDELHYHLHIYIRYQIEKDIMHDKLQASEVKDKWNAMYKEHLGLDIPNDTSGVLQDVHWSHGSIGYFPTYTLGSLYAAQFMDAASAQIPDLEDSLKSGDYSSLLLWLNKHIHSKGRLNTSQELCKKICGESINPQSFINYSCRKYLT